MLLKYFYDKQLAQASYMLGCAATGEALIIDPARHIKPYLQAAREEGLRITQVTETHIHADYVSGSRELVQATKAALYLSDEGDADWKYTYPEQDKPTLVKDGTTWMLGNIKIEVLHTPGHTPEHISFIITDTAGADLPIGIFSGDFIFAGDVGRPDLLETAAGFVGTKEIGAQAQFKSVQRIKDLPDYLQIWPGHGAGSACGKSLGAIPSTTLGYEKLFNPAFQIDDESDFAAWLLDGQPEAPNYFAQMKKVNKVGPQILEKASKPNKLNRADLDEVLAQDALVLDLRSQRQYAKAHVLGAINVPFGNSFVTYAGGLVEYDKPLYAIIPAKVELKDLLQALQSIGVDSIAGYFSEDVINAADQALPQIDASDLAEHLAQNGLVIVDVRAESEYNEGHIQGATHIPLGYLPQRVAELPQDRTIVTQCASGYRSQIAASILRRYGLRDVINLTSNTETWAKVLPIE